MNFGAPQTPQRPLPGAFLQTPAPTRNQPGGIPQRQPFAAAGPLSGAPQAPNPVPAQQQPAAQATGLLNQAPPLSAVQRAARTVNDFQTRDGRFPEIDNYVKRMSLGVVVLSAANVMQRAFHLITMSLRMMPGRLSRDRECTISRTEYSSNTIVHKLRR